MCYYVELWRCTAVYCVVGLCAVWYGCIICGRAVYCVVWRCTAVYCVVGRCTAVYCMVGRCTVW